MARSTQVIYRSDLSQEELTEAELTQVTLSYRGKTVHLDLSQTEEDKLSEALRPYLSAGQPVKEDKRTVKRADTGSGLGTADVKAVRRWWEDSKTVEGFEFKNRGRIPQQVVSAWLEKGKPSF